MVEAEVEAVAEAIAGAKLFPLMISMQLGIPIDAVAPGADEESLAEWFAELFRPDETVALVDSYAHAAVEVARFEIAQWRARVGVAERRGSAQATECEAVIRSAIREHERAELELP